MLTYPLSMNCLSPEKLVIIASTISIEISKDKTIDEINEYKNLFSLISNNLQAICSQKLLNKNLSKKDK